MRTEVKLSKRLERIASFVQPGSRVADIGTDHGYVPIWLVQKGVCPSALAMDVRKGPLERAEEHVEEVGLSGKIELRLSDGLAKLKAGEADTVVIAGMGGKLTCRILEQGRHVWENWSEGKERLILSPQSEQDEVRHFLEEQGFSILREAVLTDEGKYYIVIEAARGTMRPGREQDYRFGADLIRKKDPVLLAYLEKEEKMQIEKLPTLKLKYTLVVPFMGIVDVLTMGSFFMNPAADGKTFIKAFYVICGIVGLLFALWGLLWKTTIDGKTIRVNPVIGKKKVVPFTDLKKAIVYKKKKTGSIVSYELIDKNDKPIVTIYPLMKDSSTLMERLKRLKYPVEEA